MPWCSKRAKAIEDLALQEKNGVLNELLNIVLEIRF